MSLFWSLRGKTFWGRAYWKTRSGSIFIHNIYKGSESFGAFVANPSPIHPYQLSYENPTMLNIYVDISVNIPFQHSLPSMQSQLSENLGDSQSDSAPKSQEERR